MKAEKQMKAEGQMKARSIHFLAAVTLTALFGATSARASELLVMTAFNTLTDTNETYTYSTDSTGALSASTLTYFAGAASQAWVLDAQAGATVPLIEETI